MDAYVKMVFGTVTGTDLSITVPNVRSDISAQELQEAMEAIKDADAIDSSQGSISSIKEGILCTVVKKTFAVN